MMSKRKPDVDAQEFSDALDANEESMGEMAAFDITCHEFGISHEQGWDLLISLSEPVKGDEGTRSLVTVLNLPRSLIKGEA